MYKLVTGPIACTPTELSVILFGITGTRAVTITARTEVDVVGGKSCPFHGATKLSRVNGIIGFSYENSVNRQRVRRGAPTDRVGNVEQFVAGPRKWGTRLFSSATDRKVPLVAKNVPHARVTLNEVIETPADELYLEIKVQNSIVRQYEHNGEEVAEDLIAPHIRKSANPHQVILRDYRFDHLLEVVMDGNVYLLGAQV